MQEFSKRESPRCSMSLQPKMTTAIPEPKVKFIRRLTVFGAPMGAGKTRWAMELAEHCVFNKWPLLAPTHRTALGKSQAAALGIFWAPTPGIDGRLQGAALCWDDLRPSSALAICPDEWMGADGRGPVLVLDDIVQGLEYLLLGTHSGVAEHRPEIMATFAQLLRSARLVVALDAQLSEPVLRLLEALTGEHAFLIGSAHQPMAGRPVLVPQELTVSDAIDQARARVIELAKARNHVFVITTAITPVQNGLRTDGWSMLLMQAHAKGAAANLADLVRCHWPEARILVAADTEAAEQLGNAPNGVAGDFDWIICSPDFFSGLSIDTPGIFDQVLVIGAGGRLSCEALAKAAARVRDPACPVRIYTPTIAPQLRIGSGDTDPDALLRDLSGSDHQLLAQLVVAGGWENSAPNESPWLRCWLELATHRNAQVMAHAATVAALLESEGWAVSPPAPLCVGRIQFGPHVKF